MKKKQFFKKFLSKMHSKSMKIILFLVIQEVFKWKPNRQGKQPLIKLLRNFTEWNNLFILFLSNYRIEWAYNTFFNILVFIERFKRIFFGESSKCIDEMGAHVWINILWCEFSITRSIYGPVGVVTYDSCLFSIWKKNST